MMTKPSVAAALLCLALASVPGAQAQPVPSRAETCVTVYDFPDAGYAICYDLDDRECTVYSYTTTFLGREKDCIVPDAEGSAGAPLGPPDLREWPKCAPIAVGQACVSPYWPGCNVWIVWTAIPSPPTCLHRSDPLVTGSSEAGVAWPGGSTPDVQCMDVYSHTQVPGTNYWVVRRDSCSLQVYECPEGSSPPAPPCREASLLEASAANQEPECLQVYRETEVGPVRIVSRDSCHAEHYVCDQEKADVLATRSLDASRCETGLTATSEQPLPPVPDPFGRTCYTQGQGELQSRTCIDPESTDCTVYRQQITGQGSSWVCYPSGESGSDW